jgi:UDP-glucose 4-epimerase
MENQASRPAVLVTGGAGYIGSHAVLALLDAGWRVVVIDNLTTGFRWAVPEAASFVEGDIADQPLVARLIAEHGIGAIIHFAGSIVVPESVTNPLKYYENNTVKSRSLIESAVRGGVRHFIFSSTAATYGIPERVPIDEGMRTQPITPYGWSKLMTERMLADTAFAHPLN